MNAAVKIYNSCKKNSRQILISSGLAFIGFLTSVAIAIPLDKVQYNIIMTSDGYPIIFPKENIYGFDEKLTETELINNAEYCGSGAGCSPDALAKGALYFVVHTVNGKKVIAYYNADGKLVATQQAGTGTPTNPTTPTQLPTPNVASFSNSTADPVGYLEGEFAVSDSGAATYNVPIALPPGTAGVQPSISLAYSSQSGEGIAGLGWSISGLSAISRCPKNKVQDGEIAGVKFDGTDNYCLDGQRLVRISGTQGGNGAKYKTEIDNYSEIISYDNDGDRSPEYFEVKTKAGEIHVFGNTVDSRVERVFPSADTLTDEQKNAYSWVINRTKDRLGNYIDYVYNESRDEELGLEHNLKQIKYTGNINTGLAPYIFIDFSYQDKIQPVKGYFAGSKVYRSKRLVAVTVKMNSSALRSYNIKYYDETNDLYKLSKQDKLKSIEECGATVCLPETYFTWDGGYASNEPLGSGLAEKTTKSKYIPTDSDLAETSLGANIIENWEKSLNLGWNNFHPDYTTRLMGDVNGDGLVDVVVARYKSRSIRNAVVGLSTAKNVNSFDLVSFDTSEVGKGDSATSFTNPSYVYPSYLADVNGDGLADLVNFNWSNITVNTSNGDGFNATEVWSKNTSNQNWTYAQFTKSVTWEANKHPLFVQDINGDGKADIVGIGEKGVYVALSTGSSFTYDNTSKWSNHFGSVLGSAGSEIIGGLDYTRPESSAQLADVSGDGLPDLVVSTYGGTMVAINDLSSKKFSSLKKYVFEPCYSWFCKNPNLDLYTPPSQFYATKDTPRILGDVNGDGYPDMVGFFDKVYVAYGTGGGFLPYKDVNLLNFTKNNGGWDGGYHPRYIADINADGKGDIIAFGALGTWVALSNGDGFKDPVKWSNSFDYLAINGTAAEKGLRTLGDFNGDGLPDVIGIDYYGITIGENKAEPLRIARIITGGFVPEGGDDMSISGLHRSIEVRYEKLTAKAPDVIYTKSTSLGGINIQPAMFVVSSHHSSNGDIANNDTSLAGMKYTYSGLKVDKNGRGSLGFEKRSVEDLISHIRTTKTYSQFFPYTGSPKDELTELNIGNDTYVTLNYSKFWTTHKTDNELGGKLFYYNIITYKKTETDYSFNETNNSSIAYKLVTTDMASTDRHCGNVPWVKVTTSNLTTGKYFAKETVSKYRTTGSCFNQSRLENATVTSTSNTDTQVRKSAFTYTGDGQIHTETVEPADKLTTTTTYGYDAYGNVDSKSIRGATKSNGTGILTRSSTTVYDDKGRFAVTVFNDKNHKETRTYDKKFGTLTSVTGPNGLTSTSYYNQFGQKYLTVAPNNTWVHTTYDWCNVDMGEANNVARYCTTTKSSEGGYSKIYYDQIDRVVRKETKGLNGTTAETIYSDKIYNLDNGQLVSETLPYFKNGTPQKISYTYDKLERSSTVTQPDGSVSSIEYDGFTTTVTDAKNHEKTETINALGKPSLVEDALGNTIRYNYYADGNLRSTTNMASTNGSQVAADVPSSTTIFKYDKLGNKIEMTDPDMGIWTYAYNAFGELVSQTDANDQTTTMTYDVLGRLVTRDEDEGLTRWTYDIASGKGIGKLHKVTSSASGYSKTLSYNALGQVAKLDENIPTGIATSGTKTYTTKTTYDVHGRVDQVIYPTVNLLVAPIKVQHVYNITGALKSIKDATTGDEYWTVNTADAKGNITKQTLGNGVVTHRTYDSLGRFLDTIKSTKGSTYLQNLDYNFDTIGNLTKRENKVSGESEIFAYDSIYRLDGITTSYDIASINKAKQGGALYGFALPLAITLGTVKPAPASMSYKYDGHGNIMDKNGKDYSYTGGKTHAASLIDGIDYEYDNNGNLTCSGLGCDNASKASRIIEWKSFNKPEMITKKDATGKETVVKLAYDADHNRIVKESTHTDTAKIGKTTWYIAGGLVEREKTTSGSNSGAEIYKFSIKAGGKTVAYINQNLSKAGAFTANKIRYLLTDHLGSSDVVTDKNGAVVLKLSFDAWGKRRNASSWANSTPTELEVISAGFAEEAYKIGYTGHEHDDEVGLINMKGRLYDAEIGRFISADPYVQAATDTQSYSRYSYVRNNPLSLTDPSGYSWLSKLWKGVKKFVKKWGRTILAIAAAYFTAGLASSFFLQGSLYGAIAGGAAAGFAGTLVSTGSLKQALIGAAFGALSAGLANKIGYGQALKGLGRFGKSVAHGVAQGTVSVLRGNKFGAGFVSAFASHITGGLNKFKTVAGRTAAAAVLGGTVSKLVGGKFANGAISAAFTHLFNEEVGRIKRAVNIVKKARAEFARLYKEGLLPKEFDFIEKLKGGINSPTLRFKYRDTGGFMGEMDIYHGTGGTVFRYGALDEFSAIYTVAHEIGHAVPINAALWKSGNTAVAESNAHNLGDSVRSIWKRHH